MPLQVRVEVWSVVAVLPLSSAEYAVCSMFGGTRSMTRVDLSTVTVHTA